MYLCHNNLPYRYKFNKNTPPLQYFGMVKFINSCSSILLFANIRKIPPPYQTLINFFATASKTSNKQAPIAHPPTSIRNFCHRVSGVSTAYGSRFVIVTIRVSFSLVSITGMSALGSESCRFWSLCQSVPFRIPAQLSATAVRRCDVVSGVMISRTSPGTGTSTLTYRIVSLYSV